MREIEVYEVDSSTERQLLMGMITSTKFIKKIFQIFKYEYLDMPTSVKISKWVLEYYDKYNKAPGKLIADIFEEKSKKLSDSDYEWIANFLDRLSDEYENSDFNEDYLFTKVNRYFKKQKMLKAGKLIEELVKSDKIEEAMEVWGDSIKVADDDEELGLNPFNVDVVRNHFRRDPRFTLGLGIEPLDIMSGHHKSEWLVMFMGPMKRGKTQALFHTAVRATMQGFNTVLYSLESGYEDIIERFWMNIGSISTEKKKIDFPYYKNKKTGDIEYHTESRPHISDEDTVMKSVKTFNKLAKGNLWVKSFPAYSANVFDIKRHLNSLEVYQNFIPHVIIVDYLGAMRPPKGKTGRDVYDHNSKELKGLAQERKAIVFSAHQGNKKTLEKMNMSATDVPEDVRVLANVDVLFGLNQTEEEKEQNIMRINILLHRFKKFSRLRQAQVLYQPEAGQFHIDSKLIDAPKPKPMNSKLAKDDDDDD